MQFSGKSPARFRESKPIRVVRLGRVGSTNREADQAIRTGLLADGGGALFVAEEQTAGEGRRGAHWHSPPGGLWTTLAYPLPDPPKPILDGLGLRLGLSALRTVGEIAGRQALLKWPNDILIEGRKICGCMAKTIQHEGRLWLLAGVGINANNTIDSPEPLRLPAAGLAEITGGPIDLEALLATLLDQLAWLVRTPGIDPATLDEANAALFGVGEPIHIRDGNQMVEGTLERLGASGCPIVRTASGFVEVGPGADTVHDE